MSEKNWYDISNFQEISWDDVEPGQRVYIAGNLKDNKPTRVYGLHYVVDSKEHLLKSNNNKKEFNEDWYCLYIPNKITKEKFYEMTSREPEGDDLERVNCFKVGQIGHQFCGVCNKCQQPRFVCGCKN